MKTNRLNFTLIVSFLAAVFVTGCATTTTADWNSRVGHYTYAQAVSQLGPPNREVGLSDGKTAFRWFAQPAPSANRVNVGGLNQPSPNNSEMNTGFGSQPVYNNPAFNSQYLQLTFDANGVLTAWSQNY